MAFKYIAFEGPLFQEIVLFPDTRDHAAFARMMHIDPKDILGAGFVRMSENNPPSCWGQSTSLRIQSRGIKDSAILLRFSGYE